MRSKKRFMALVLAAVLTVSQVSVIAPMAAVASNEIESEEETEKEFPDSTEADSSDESESSTVTERESGTADSAEEETADGMEVVGSC